MPAGLFNSLTWGRNEATSIRFNHGPLSLDLKLDSFKAIHELAR